MNATSLGRYKSDKLAYKDVQHFISLKKCKVKQRNTIIPLLESPNQNIDINVQILDLPKTWSIMNSSLHVGKMQTDTVTLEDSLLKASQETKPQP